MVAGLALLSSVFWGVSDFLGGLFSRRVEPLRLIAQSTPYGIPPLLLFTLLVPGTLTATGFWLGLGAGVFGAFGILLLYVVLAAGPMGVMSPLTAVVSAVVPVVVGLVRGERPGALAYVGMALAVVAIVLVSVEPKRDDDETHQVISPKILALALLSGLGIGGYLAMIGIAPAGSGVWPVLVSRTASAVILLVIAVWKFRGATFVRIVFWPAVAVGVLDATANAFYRISAEGGLLSIVAVLGALYPAATVVLARFVLHERLRPSQQLGMLTAITAALLLATAAA